MTFSTFQDKSIFKQLNYADFDACGGLKIKGTSICVFYINGSLLSSGFQPVFKDVATDSKNQNVTFCTCNLSKGQNMKLVDNKGFSYKIDFFPFIVIFYEGQPCSVYREARSKVEIEKALRRTISCDLKCK